MGGVSVRVWELEVQIEKKCREIQRSIDIPATMENQIALEAIRKRLLALARQEYVVELFEQKVLSLSDMDRLTNIESVNRLIDSYLDVANFYVKNRRVFRWMICEDFFVKKIQENGLQCWDELMSRSVSYRNLNAQQSISYVSSVLFSMPNHRHMSVEPAVENNNAVLCR